MEVVATVGAVLVLIGLVVFIVRRNARTKAEVEQAIRTARNQELADQAQREAEARLRQQQAAAARPRPHLVKDDFNDNDLPRSAATRRPAEPQRSSRPSSPEPSRSSSTRAADTRRTDDDVILPTAFLSSHSNHSAHQDNDSGRTFGGFSHGSSSSHCSGSSNSHSSGSHSSGSHSSHSSCSGNSDSGGGGGSDGGGGGGE